MRNQSSTSFDDLRKQLIKAILSCPIVYIQHHHNYFIDSVLKDILTYPTLNLSNQSILEYDYGLDGIVSFDSKELDKNYTAFNEIRILLRKIVVPSLPIDVYRDDYKKDLEDKRLFLFRGTPQDMFGSVEQSLIQSFATKYESGKYDKHTTIIIISPEPANKLPKSISKYITVLGIKPPTTDEIRRCVISIAGEQCFNDPQKRKDAEEMVRTLQGLQLYDVKQVLETVYSAYKQIHKRAVKLALEEKKRIVMRSGIIEVMDSDESFKDVGGLKRLCKDLDIKSQIYGNLGDANKYNIPIPKGILIVGMPGCGKSMIAKATANKFGVSLLRVDVSRLMGKYVGESEANLRLALATAEAAHPCVLWIDEIEKAFAGGNNPGGDEDMLVLRMMGHFLTWMQERKSPVYIVATANGVLRPEFMRKGRFDEVYFVDFPTKQEAAEILRKKIEKRYPLSNKECLFDFSEIDDYTDITYEMDGQFAGSEIECVLNMVVERKFLDYLKEKEANKDNEDFIPAKITIKKSDFRSVIDDMKKSIMANQKGRKGQKTAIEQIRQMQDIYNFTNASESSE